MSGHPVSRRAVVRSAGVATVVGGLCLNGCDLDLGTAQPAASPTAEPDPDERVLLAARAELTALIVRVSASSGGPDLPALALAHRAQLAALGGQQPSGTGRARPLPPRRLVARERVAVARFTAWAAQVQSGDLARVLAAVAAGIDMQPVLRSAG